MRKLGSESVFPLVCKLLSTKAQQTGFLWGERGVFVVLFFFIVAKGMLEPMATGQGKVGGVRSEDVLAEVSDSNSAPKPHNVMIPLHSMATHTNIPCFPGCCGTSSLSCVIYGEILVS